jgi:hypothetical protein
MECGQILQGLGRKTDPDQPLFFRQDAGEDKTASG